MIIEMYFSIQCLIVALLFLGWTKHHPMFWVLSFIFAAINIFASYNLEYIIHIVTSTSTIVTETVSLSYPILSYINIMFAMIAMLMFFWDIFNPQESLDRDK